MREAMPAHYFQQHVEGISYYKLSQVSLHRLFIGALLLMISSFSSSFKHTPSLEIVSNAAPKNPVKEFCRPGSTS